MNVYIIGFLFLLLFIVLPEKFWGHGLEFISQLRNSINEILNHVPFIGLQRRGGLLLSQVSSWSSESSLGLFTKSYVFFPYKFYSNLLEDLYKLERQDGVVVKSFLLEIRKSLMQDISFEKKKKTEIGNGFYQMFFMSGIIFLFLFVLESQLNLKVPFFLKLGIILWQLIGTTLFALTVIWIENKIFTPFSDFIYYLYRLRSMCSIHIDANALFLSFREFCESTKKHKSTKSSVNRVEELLIRLRDMGIPIGSELKEIQEDLWDDMLFEFEKFQKKLFFMKFLVLTFFFLATYLVFVLYLFSFFME